MQLSFKDGHFILFQPGGNFLSSEWKPVARGKFKTNNIREAVRFRRVADSNTERIFKRFMLRNMPLPSGGLLSNIPLLDFQAERGVPFILGQNHTYVAHEPGLGKSLQWITAVGSKGATGLITCPNFLKINWAREITKGLIDDFPEIEIVPPTPRRRETNWGARFLIVPDSLLDREWVQKGIRFHRKKDMLAIDEAHRFKTPEANRTISLYGGNNGTVSSRGIVYDRDYVTALSGTPMLNRPMELWPTLYSLAPQTIDFMPQQDFGFKYCGAWQDERGHWHYDKFSNEQILSDKIMGKFIQYIKKEDVLKDLPPKVREVIPMSEDPRDANVIQFDKELMAKLRSFKDVPKSMGEWAKLRHYNGLAKVDFAAEFVDFYLSNDLNESIILFAHHRDVVQILAKKLAKWKPVVIQGGVDDDVRIKIEDAFQARRRRLIIGNLDAMNLGLTLTAASRVVFAEYDWTHAKNEQGEDRAYRIGTPHSVFAQYIVLPGSIDERILLRVMEKKQGIERIVA